MPIGKISAKHLPLVAAVLTFAACTEPERAMLAPAHTAPQAGIHQLVTADDWDYYAADIEVTFEGVAPVSGTQTITFAEEKQLDGEGYWTTTTAYDPYHPFVGAPGGFPAGQFSRVISRDDGSRPRHFNDAGAEFSPVMGPSPVPPSWRNTTPPPGEDPLPVIASMDSSVVGDTMVASPSLGSDPAGQNPVRRGRRWVDNVVVTDSSRARLARALRSRLGAPSVEGTRLIYRGQLQSGRSIEVVVDTVVGAVVEERVLSSGHIALRARHAYESMEFGGLIRASTRIEKTHRRGMAVVTVRRSNVRIEKRGGAQ